LDRKTKTENGKEDREDRKKEKTKCRMKMGRIYRQ